MTPLILQNTFIQEHFGKAMESSRMRAVSVQKFRMHKGKKSSIYGIGNSERLANFWGVCIRVC